MNVPQAITHVLSYFENNIADCRELLELTDDFYKEVIDFKREEDSPIRYSGEVHKTRDEYKENCDELMESISEDVKLIRECMDIIIANKYDDQVIFSLKKFAPFTGDYEDISKDADALLNKAVHAGASAYRDSDFVKTSMFRAVETTCKSLSNIASRLYEKIDLLVGEDSDEE